MPKTMAGYIGLSIWGRVNMNNVDMGRNCNDACVNAINNPVYRPRIFKASDIGHPGGDNGEQLIVFFRALNPLDSGWLFKATIEEAEQEVGKYLDQPEGTSGERR